MATKAQTTENPIGPLKILSDHRTTKNHNEREGQARETFWVMGNFRNREKQRTQKGKRGTRVEIN